MRLRDRQGQQKDNYIDQRTNLAWLTASPEGLESLAHCGQMVENAGRSCCLRNALSCWKAKKQLVHCVQKKQHYCCERNRQMWACDVVVSMASHEKGGQLDSHETYGMSHEYENRSHNRCNEAVIGLRSCGKNYAQPCSEGIGGTDRAQGALFLDLRNKGTCLTNSG